MFYVKRNDEGDIDAVFLSPHPKAMEQLGADNEELQAYLAGHSPSHLLRESDREMIRVIEDLIEVLILKGVLTITDLPTSAVAKIGARKRIRDMLDSYQSVA